MSPKTISITCAGYDVVADWYQGSNSSKVMLVLIGFTSARVRHQQIIEAICQATGTSALVFDYTGHGDSPMQLRDTRPAQHFLEVICVFDWLKQQHPDTEITVMGTSYGGFLATQLTKYREFDQLILRVPAVYRPQDFYTPWSYREDNPKEYLSIIKPYRADPAALAEHPLLKRASKFAGRTLVVVHDDDELVPKETTDAYISAFHAEMYLAKGFSHSPKDLSDARWQPYHQVIIDWLQKR